MFDDFDLDKTSEIRARSQKFGFFCMVVAHLTMGLNYLLFVVSPLLLQPSSTLIFLIPLRRNRNHANLVGLHFLARHFLAFFVVFLPFNLFGAWKNSYVNCKDKRFLA